MNDVSTIVGDQQQQRMVVDLQMVHERDEQSSARLRVIEKDPHGDDINGLMPPNELDLLSESEKLQHMASRDKLSGKVIVDVPI